MTEKNFSTATTSKTTSSLGHNKTGLSVHPLFFLAGIASAFTGSLLLFLSACLAAVEHECAHAFVARRYGLRLNKIVLMPYGAVVSGDIKGIAPKEELAVCAAGPLCNAATALLFVALWWLFPETYPYTEAAATVSFSLFLVNLLPAYPLDGGRMLMVALRRLGERRARIAAIALNVFTSLGVASYFVFTCFSTPNFSALFFSVMLLFGAWGGGKYEKLNFSHKKSFARGVEEKRIAVSHKKTLGSLLRFLREDRYLVFVLYDGEEFLGEVSEAEYLAALKTNDYASPVAVCLPLP